MSTFARSWWLVFAFLGLGGSVQSVLADARPNIVLVMADDQGWGETGYYGHPVLKTPHLDEMAANAAQFDRFYAGCPVCSPTRAAVLTGRTNNRTGVQSHGYALRIQEKTISQALKAKGYATGHFGKWHLNAIRGPGVPILESDPRNPGVFGFDDWLSVTNFFDRDPILSRKGVFEEHKGDSSEIVVQQALRFINAQAKLETPSFTVIWFGTPHSPFRASEEDAAPFDELERESKNHYGELVAMDRAIGSLRSGLREAAIAEETLVWFCSDNGGLPKIKPTTVGNLRGYKGSLYEGGLRVPCLVEWPSVVTPRKTQHPAMVVDMASTIAEIVGIEDDAFLHPQDGMSLLPVLRGVEEGPRPQSNPLVFNYAGETALIDNDWKLLQLRSQGKKSGRNAQLHYELYNLREDPSEKKNRWQTEPEIAERMEKKLRDFLLSLNASVAGKDYPSGVVRAGEPEPRQWTEIEAYEPFFKDWRSRPEYSARLKRREK